MELGDANGFLTARLNVAPWGDVIRNADTRAPLKQDLLELLTPEVVRYLPPQLALAAGASGMQNWIDARDATGEVFIVDARKSGQFLGLLFLMDAIEAGQNTKNIGYMFTERAWGKGYASELIEGVVQSRTNITLRGGVAKGNDASVRVLLKNGFLKNVDLSSADVDMFELHR